jgi:hypothetical protein
VKADAVGPVALRLKLKASATLSLLRISVSKAFMSSRFFVNLYQVMVSNQEQQPKHSEKQKRYGT